MKKNYEDLANDLSKAIDIAVQAFQTYPPANFDEPMISHTIKTYLEWKNMALYPSPGYKNLKSLTFLTNDVFIPFHETSGKAVDFFWKEVKNMGLTYKRENKLTKILKHQKIKTHAEYDFAVDVMVPYQQEGLLSENETALLNTLIAEFEQQNGIK